MARILIVEDDWELNRGIAWQLEKAHYETCVAYSVEEAKRILCEESVHLVLLDVNLPDGDGAEGSYEETILAIKREAREIHGELTKENIIEKFRDAFQEKAFGRIIELGCKVARTAVLHRLGVD